MYRNTYVAVNVAHIQKNVEMLIRRYSDYQYYFAVVKADSYGHNHLMPVRYMIAGGCNYLAVSSLEEALELRKELRDIPILCLGIIPLTYLEECVRNHITITISNRDYFNQLLQLNPSDLKAHLKVNTGMNRLGFSKKEDLNFAYQALLKSEIELEGIYTHIYDAGNAERSHFQYQRFEEMMADIDLKQIPIVHLNASEATIQYPKREYANGCRLGIAMYGLSDTKMDFLQNTFQLYSEVIQINEVTDSTVGYGGNYQVHGQERIAVVSIGYADGIIRKNTGRFVYIQEKAYPIVGNICMDMLFVKVDNQVQVGDRVAVIRDIEHIRKIADYLDTIPYEVICSIGKRVPRIYIDKE